MIVIWICSVKNPLDRVTTDQCCFFFFMALFFQKDSFKLSDFTDPYYTGNLPPP